MLYRIRHKPTGLYVDPKPTLQLKEVGKIYQKATDILKTHNEIFIWSSKVIKKYKEKLDAIPGINYHGTVGMYCSFPIQDDDFEIEEVTI